MRVVKRSSGGAVHEIRLEDPGDASRLDLVRRMSLAGAQPEAMLRPDGGERPANKVFLSPTLPCHSLSLELRFPASAVPSKATVTCSPRACPPEKGLENIASVLRPEGLSAEVDRERGRVCFRMERPLIGLRIAVTWE